MSDGVAGYPAKNVAKYILWMSRRDQDPITPMQLLKLVYIAHGWMLGINSRPLLNEQVEAWRYGPVVPSVYNAYKQFGGQIITECPAERPVLFDEAAQVVLESTWTAYRAFTGPELSELTHADGTPWSLSYQPGRNRVIGNDLIEQHYRTLARRGVA